MSITPQLVIMARVPVAGAVKTRLASEIGTSAAIRFYRRSLTSLVSRVGRDGRWQSLLAVTPDKGVDHAGMRRLGLDLVPQGSGDLGQRMQRLMDAQPAGPVVIVGTDIPGIRRRHIASAFRALGENEAVFGPADDGGYWLVGLRRRPRVPRAFGGVRWSSCHALDDTLANLDGMRVARLETLVDVDTRADLRRWTTGRRGT